VTRGRAGSDFAAAQGLDVCTDYPTLLQDAALDAVILCTPHSTHLDQILAAAAAGKHVFCEKPLALNRRDAETAIAACNGSRVTLGVGHERRFDPAVSELRRRVAAGELGTPLQVEATFNQDKFLDLPADNWRLSMDEGPAGPMTATGVHMLDLSISFLGPVDRVFANVKTLASPLANGDTLGVLAMFRSGAQALIGAVLTTPYDGRFALYGTDAWADIRDFSHPDAPGGTALIVCHKGDRHERLDFPAASPIRANIESFADAAQGRGVYPMSQEEMIWNIAALEAVFKSAGSGMVEQVGA
jgi:predicted dehydrogenase